MFENVIIRHKLIYIFPKIRQISSLTYIVGYICFVD